MLESPDNDAHATEEEARTPASAYDNAVARMSDQERASVLDRVVREGPSHQEPDWLIVDAALKVRDATNVVASALTEVQSVVVTVKELQEQILKTAESLSREREERIGKIVEPIAKLTEALVRMGAVEQRAQGAKEVTSEAITAIRSMVTASEKMVRTASLKQGIITYLVIAAAALEVWVLILLLQRR